MSIPILIVLNLAFILLALTHNGSPPTISTPTRFGYVGPGMMALPQRAYSERQKMSPIRIGGIIKEVTCNDNSLYRIQMQVESIQRNNSARPLAIGDVIVIAAQASSPGSQSPSEHQAPMIGLPDPSVRIPPICSRAQAWLRPAEIAGDHSPANTYELMAGPYGFGPSLEE